MAVVAAALLGLALFGAAPAVAQEEDLPSRAELWRIIQKQQDQIDALKSTVDRLSGEGDAPATAAAPAQTDGDSVTAGKLAEAEREIADLKQQVEETSSQVEETEKKVEATGGMLERALSNLGGGDGWWQNTSIGGYGELHFNAGDKDEIDFHRFVLFVGHRFNDWIRLQTELELEHALAGEGKEGEVELEQAYVELDLTEGAGLQFGEYDRHYLRAGLFLVPVGILNETHEPPTFFGVERNNVENRIIPTTWWEAGAHFTGQFSRGLSYDVAFHSGLDVPIQGGSAFLIRSGRNKVSEAPANNPAVTGRLRWTGVPGVELAATVQYQDDVTQGRLGVDAFLFETHANIRKGPFGLRALYARWDLDGAAPEMLGRDEQYGWYIEPSYRFDALGGELGFFTRYQSWDNAAGDTLDSKFAQLFLGMNYWPHPDVVFKVDYQIDDSPVGVAEDDRFNLGVGFQF